MRTAFRQSRQSGFTLLEVMAAFVVFALAFGAVLQVLSGSLRNASRSAEYTEAALWAQTMMDRVGLEIALEEFSDSGEFNDDYRWELAVREFEVPYEGDLALDLYPVALFEVELLVEWGTPERPRQAVFRTLRAANPVRN